MNTYHLLHTFRYCPACGSARFADNDARSRRCPDCGFTFYCNASAATVAIIRNARGEILLTRRGRNPGKGGIGIPGGFVDPGETLEAGCLREVLEETGVEGRIRRFLFTLPNVYPFGGFEVQTVDAFFEVEIDTPEAVRPGDDAEALFWVAPEALDYPAIAMPSVREGLRRLFAK